METTNSVLPKSWIIYSWLEQIANKSQAVVSSSRNLSLFEAGPYKVCEGDRKKVGVQKKVIGPSRKAVQQG